VAVKGAPQLELRHMLRMPRETFGRLVNVSVRTIATIESEQKKAGRIQRDYVEVKRLCDALSEVVEPSALGEWFRAPNEAFGGSKPIEVIERGEIDRLWDMFYRLRSGVPG
jgi:DNA-binding XRE family transcriptional regulator